MKLKPMQIYLVRHKDSELYTSVNTIEYVMKLFNKTRPPFYKNLVYELIDTNLTFRDLTLRLPFDRNLKRVSSLKLNQIEKELLKYHIRELRKYSNDI